MIGDKKEQCISLTKPLFCFAVLCNLRVYWWWKRKKKKITFDEVLQQCVNSWPWCVNGEKRLFAFWLLLLEWRCEVTMNWWEQSDERYRCQTVEYNVILYTCHDCYNCKRNVHCNIVRGSHHRKSHNINFFFFLHGLCSYWDRACFSA